MSNITRRLGAVLVVMVIELAPATALAQQAASPRIGSAAISIKIAAVVLGEPGTETPLGIQITPASAVPANSFLRIRGIPAAVALTDGHAIAPGAWAIPLEGLSELKLRVPAATQSKSELSLALFSIEGSILAEAKSTLLVAPAGLITSPAPQPQTVPSPTTVPQLPAPRRTEALRFFERAQAQSTAGAIVAARALLERAADMGLPEAAMALAATYDAWEMPRLGVMGMLPDPHAAQKWYIRARELGALGAVERLQRLPKP